MWSFVSRSKPAPVGPFTETTNDPRVDRRRGRSFCKRAEWLRLSPHDRLVSLSLDRIRDPLRVELDVEGEELPVVRAEREPARGRVGGDRGAERVLEVPRDRGERRAFGGRVVEPRLRAIDPSAELSPDLGEVAHLVEMR